MLRKLILLAITSGLAKKGWDFYKARQSADAPVAARPRRVASKRVKPAPQPTHHRATTVGESV
jgi:hypothetical protein